MMNHRLLGFATGLFYLFANSACVTIPSMDFSAYHEAKPRSILIIPIVNESVDVQAPTSVLTTLPHILGERGYYVFPVNTVKTLLEYEGLYEPAEVHAMPPQELADLFGADAILYVKIHEWTAKYVFLQTTTEVNFEYRIVNRDGTNLWEARKQLEYSSETDSSGNLFVDLIASAVSAAIERADPNYLPLTRQANYQVFNTDDTAIPPGPYATDYEDYYRSLKEKK